MYGDWYVYNDFELCQQFKEKYDYIVVIDDKQKEIQLEVSIKKLTIEKISDGKMGQKQVDVFSVHIGVKIPNGIMFRHINGGMIKHAFEHYDLLVLKQNRALRSACPQAESLGRQVQRPAHQGCGRGRRDDPRERPPP